jgi:hypothetical protein
MASKDCRYKKFGCSALVTDQAAHDKEFAESHVRLLHSKISVLRSENKHFKQAIHHAQTRCRTLDVEIQQLREENILLRTQFGLDSSTAATSLIESSPEGVLHEIKQDEGKRRTGANSNSSMHMPVNNNIKNEAEAVPNFVFPQEVPAALISHQKEQIHKLQKQLEGLQRQAAAQQNDNGVKQNKESIAANDLPHRQAHRHGFAPLDLISNPLLSNHSNNQLGRWLDEDGMKPLLKPFPVNSHKNFTLGRAFSRVPSRPQPSQLYTQTVTQTTTTVSYDTRPPEHYSDEIPGASANSNSGFGGWGQRFGLEPFCPVLQLQKIKTKITGETPPGKNDSQDNEDGYA